MKNRIIKKQIVSITSEKLEMREAELLILRQSKKDKQEEKNSKLETKIKVLENKAFRNKVKTDADIAEIDRELEKILELKKVEQKCANNLAGPDSDKYMHKLVQSPEEKQDKSLHKLAMRIKQKESKPTGDK